MTDPSSLPDGKVSAGPDGANGQPRAALDDIMIAMDVVDTLRHDQRIVDRELDEEARRANLIKRLREIYRGQGIEVPDRILEEGVRALEEDRFAYTAPRPGFATRLATLYVKRLEWGRYLGGALLGLILVWGGWYLVSERPRQIAKATGEIELSETLPEAVRTTLQRIQSTATEDTVRSDAARIANQGLAAAKAGDRKAAITARDELNTMATRLATAYDIRIVNRKGTMSGLWRIPKVNKTARNYYVVVEAVDSRGTILPQSILNEETGRHETVSSWGIRVPQKVFDRVRADKADDGILQMSVVARKVRGKLEPDWRIETLGGAITRWSEK